MELSSWPWISKIGFCKSKVDDCFYTQSSTIFIVYLDNGIFINTTNININTVTKQLSKIYNLEVKCHTEDLIIHMKHWLLGAIKLSQPQLIGQILKDVMLSLKFDCALSFNILRKLKTPNPFDNIFQYRSVLGKLNFLKKESCIDSLYVIHHCAQFSNAK